MKPNDVDRFAVIIGGFCALRGGKPLSTEGFTLYWRAMQDWTIEDFETAAGRLAKTCQFLPMPKDFEDLRKAGRRTAGEAWDAALAHVRSHQYERGPTGDELLDTCVRIIGGYQAIAMSDESKLHFLARIFAEHYETIADRTETREAVPSIAFDRMYHGAALGFGKPNG